MPNPHEQITTDTLHAMLPTPVRYCPSCGASLESPQGFVHEYWVCDDRHFHTWCPACLFLCTVVLSRQITSHEPEH